MNTFMFESEVKTTNREQMTKVIMIVVMMAIFSISGCSSKSDSVTQAEFNAYKSARNKEIFELSNTIDWVEGRVGVLESLHRNR